jgi:tRNA threonylcarbamoyl adenosine modification protein (Sua5/YciO/YrdC/YwlC family)
MSEVHQVDPARPEAASEATRAAATAVGAGLAVVFPTDTVYGLATRPDVPDATKRLFEAKRRPAGLSLPVLSSSADQAFSVAERTEAAAALAARFWPGPLTLVLRRSSLSGAWYLGEREDSVGVRVPDHPISEALLRATGPLATTSANISGHPPLLDQQALLEAFGESVAVYLMLPPGDRPPGQPASTVVDLTGPVPLVVRPGPIDLAELRAALGGIPAEPTG